MSDLHAPSSAYVTSEIGNLHVLCWREAPSAADLLAVARELESLDQQDSEIRHCIVIIPSDVNVPDPNARRDLVEMLDRLLSSVASVQLVVEGTDYDHTRFLNAIDGLILVAGRRGRIAVHQAFDDALRECGDNDVTNATVVVSLLAAGILTAA